LTRFLIGIILKGSGRGVVGWKAPPKPVRKEVKAPTQMQADAANRLYMGHSTTGAISRRASLGQQPQGANSNNPVNQYGIVLDPQEYGVMMPIAVPGGGVMYYDPFAVNNQQALMSDSNSVGSMRMTK
jgi:hypothetical protein